MAGVAGTAANDRHKISAKMDQGNVWFNERARVASKRARCSCLAIIRDQTHLEAAQWRRNFLGKLHHTV